MPAVLNQRQSYYRIIPSNDISTTLHVVYFSLRFYYCYSYYLFCVGSRSTGYLRLGVQARMHETKLTSGISNLVRNEIQRINITPSLLSEQQVCDRFHNFLF
jgi:hypothetical protein